jgi:peptide/nickel transport system permease protein
MTWFLLRRIGGALILLLVMSAMVYALFYLVPGDPAVLVCGKGCDGAHLAQVREKLGLNEPVYVQYWHFLEGIFVGRDYGSGAEVSHCPAPCLGFSFQTDEPVTSLLKDRLPVSLSLALGGEVIALVLGIGGGLLSALRRGRISERVLTGVILVGYSTPVFIIGLLLLMLFSSVLGWLPFPSYVSFTDDPVQWAQNLILPWVSLALIQAAVYARMSRAGMLDTLMEDHIRTFRAYGLRERQIIGRHALRGSLTPVITLAGIDLAQMMTAAVLTETMFGLPGIGRMTVDAVNSSDIPIIVGVTLIGGLAIVLANTAADVMHAAVDPRVKLA